MKALTSGRRATLAAFLSLALIVGLVLTLPFVRSRQHRHHETEVVVLAGAYAFHFDTLPEMVATSAAVVEGTVTGAARGRVIDDVDVTYTRRLLTIRVDRALAGRPIGDRLTVETAGWRQVLGQSETELRMEDEVPVLPGAHGIFFLYDFDHDGHYGFINDQGALLMNAGTVQRSNRTDALVKELEARTPFELTALINQANGAIARGRVRAHSYPGHAG
jgi:hypothetical protein